VDRSHPAWLEVQAVRTPLNAELLQLHKGEAEAIAFAQELNATVLIIDEKEGREIAVRRGIPITGLLGVLRDAAARNLVDFPSALADLHKQLSECRQNCSPIFSKNIVKGSRKTANKEVAFYETFFAAVGVWVDSIDIIKPTYTLACQYGLGALDALLVTAAERAGAEMVSAEKPSKPIYRAHSLASSIY
jgi:hypothetical protein